MLVASLHFVSFITSQLNQVFLIVTRQPCLPVHVYKVVGA